MTRAGDGAASRDGPVHWIAMSPPFGAKELRWLRTRRVRRLVARRCGPTSIIERYYNFGGEGILAARGARRARRCSR